MRSNSPKTIKKIELDLFKFFDKGKGAIPDGFDDIYLCDMFQIPYTTLVQQPDWWIERMQLWILQRQKAQDAKKPPDK